MPENAELIECDFYIDYVTISDEEKSLFHTNELEYFFNHTEPPIIQTIDNKVEKILLHYTKPVKELFFVFSPNNENGDIYDFKSIENIEIRLNNIKLETSDSEEYFRLLQPYFHNRKVPDKNDNIYMYSFALDPDNEQPTGSYNFGNMRSKELTIYGAQGNNIRIYANTNNVLNIRDGYASVKYV